MFIRRGKFRDSVVNGKAWIARVVFVALPLSITLLLDSGSQLYDMVVEQLLAVSFQLMVIASSVLFDGVGSIDRRKLKLNVGVMYMRTADPVWLEVYDALDREADSIESADSSISLIEGHDDDSDGK